jgi:hypothetical protein
MAQKTQKTKHTQQKTLILKGFFKHHNTKNVLIEPKNVKFSMQTNTQNQPKPTPRNPQNDH